MITGTVGDTARLAAEQANVEVREIHDVPEMNLVDRLFAATWGSDEQDAVSVNMMKAMAHAGHYVAGAWRKDDLLGASVGFAWAPGGPPRLHSHIAGVSPEAQGGGVGFALKLHQAAWAIERRLTQITWTFDPLVRRNAWFNLMKLGATAASYHIDFYGQMNDGVNNGEMSDRCLVIWDLTSGVPRPRNEVKVDGATVLLRQRRDGRPERSGEIGAAALACQVPFDVVELRRTDHALSQEWRLALRATLGHAMQNGYVATAMTRDGHYFLERIVD